MTAEHRLARLVIRKGSRPPVSELPEDTPPEAVAIIEACWSADRSLRLTAAQCVVRIDAMLRVLRAGSAHAHSEDESMFHECQRGIDSAAIKVGSGKIGGGQDNSLSVEADVYEADFLTADGNAIDNDVDDDDDDDSALYSSIKSVDERMLEGLDEDIMAFSRVTSACEETAKSFLCRVVRQDRQPYLQQAIASYWDEINSSDPTSAPGLCLFESMRSTGN